MPRLKSRISWVDTAYLILKSSRTGPIHYVELTNLVLLQIRKRDPERIWGRTPQFTLNTALAKDARFRRVGRGLWDLAERRKNT